MPSGTSRGDRDQIPFLPEPKQSQPMNPHVSSSLLPTQLLDRRFRTSLSIKEIAGGNNSTRVLSPLYPGANTSVNLTRHPGWVSPKSPSGQWMAGFYELHVWPKVMRLLRALAARRLSQLSLRNGQPSLAATNAINERGQSVHDRRRFQKWALLRHGEHEETPKSSSKSFSWQIGR